MRMIDTAFSRNFIYTEGDVTITEKTFMVICNGAGEYDVTLPLAADAAGLIFVISAEDPLIANDQDVVSADVTNIYPGGLDVAAVDKLTFTAIGDYTILYSDGNNWYQLAGVQT